VFGPQGIEPQPIVNEVTMKRVFALGVCVLAVAAMPLAQTAKPAASQPAGLSEETRQKLLASLDHASAFVLAQQKSDGSYERHPGISAMVASALLGQPAPARDKVRDSTNKTLDYLRTLAKPDGGIYVKDIPHYMTAVSTMAFVAGGRPQDQPLVTKARQYLREHLLDEGEGVSPTDKFYGGMGYGGTSDGGRADIISLEYGLRAMKEAGLAVNDGAWQRAMKFLERTQNNSETNDQKWAGNDGGFIYYPGYSQAGETHSYGAATYAGLMSYAWANVKKTDPRVQSVLKWVRNNYSVDENPGLGQKTVYYYYLVFAKALQAYGEGTIVDVKGRHHNWREDLGRKLLTLQKPQGYWVNTDPAELQDNKTLVTAFTMQAIEAVIR
jgi:squalene-hopene/tetraprenyl-beta-curcumene cyclase